ncbi:hypothetical protein EW145_g6310 [Phellinidium pouzarii]|uniref:Uncharacterized protein n=1 Tax=Phellinidium pouzarii TaxID=167371 RepID=A0A4S4KYT0_9AGAM|nr:hypothetical protein EW145_g6310 [Phellinidium pouzarii]
MFKAQRVRCVLFGKRKQMHKPSSQIESAVSDGDSTRGANDDTEGTLSSKSSDGGVKQAAFASGRKRGNSLSKLVEAVKHGGNLNRRIRSGSVSKLVHGARQRSASDAELISLNAGWNEFLVSERRNFSERPSSSKAAADSNTESLSAVASSESPSFAKIKSMAPQSQQTCFAQRVPGTQKSDNISYISSIAGHTACVLSLSLICEERSPSMSPTLALPPCLSGSDSSPLRLSEPILSGCVANETCDNVLESGMVPNGFCHSTLLPNTSVLAIPCPPRISRRLYLRRWTLAMIFLGASSCFLGEAAILLTLLAHYSSVLSVQGTFRVFASSWITTGATCSAIFFVLCFWTQVEWAYGKRPTAILFPKRLLFV